MLDRFDDNPITTMFIVVGIASVFSVLIVFFLGKQNPPLTLEILQDELSKLENTANSEVITKCVLLNISTGNAGKKLHTSSLSNFINRCTLAAEAQQLLMD